MAAERSDVPPDLSQSPASCGVTKTNDIGLKTNPGQNDPDQKASSHNISKIYIFGQSAFHRFRSNKIKIKA